MQTIGFRAETGVVHYAVVDSALGPEALRMPADGKVLLQGDEPSPKALHLLRTQLITIIQSYKLDGAGVRLSDKPQGPANVLGMLKRARVEGVILEAIGACGLSAVAGASATIKSKMKTKTAIREYAEQDSIRGIDLSAKKNKILREAVVAAISALGK